MYAVIETGGKQYRVEVGTQLEVELLDAKAGDTVTIDRVLLVADGDTAAIGHPVVAEASVSAEVLRQERGEKVISFKYRPKARRRVKKGHRQELLVLRIADIVLNGKSAAAEVKKAESDAKTERQRLEEAARRQAAEDAALAAKLAAAKAPKSDSADAKGSAAAAKPAGSKPAARKSTAKADVTPATGSKPAAKPAVKPAAKAAAPKKPAAKADAAAKPAPKKPRATKKDE
jgi:large subunit ribosomal protein L21